MQTSAPRTYHFGQAFLNELIEFGTSSFAGLPTSLIFAGIVFMLDTTLRSATAKLYFVCGFFIELLLFYSFGVICFPRTTSSSGTNTSSNYNQSAFGANDYEDEMFGGGQSDNHKNLLGKIRFLTRPFQHFTVASTFNFSAGYVLGYWGNLNILTGSSNAMIVVAYYAAFVLFSYLFSVFYMQGAASWSSALVSTVVGVIGGMLCSSIIASRVKLEAGYDSQFVTNDNINVDGTTVSLSNGKNSNEINGATACDGNSNDLVCKVFQASS